PRRPERAVGRGRPGGRGTTPGQSPEKLLGIVVGISGPRGSLPFPCGRGPGAGRSPSVVFRRAVISASTRRRGARPQRPPVAFLPRSGGPAGRPAGPVRCRPAGGASGRSR